MLLDRAGHVHELRLEVLGPLSGIVQIDPVPAPRGVRSRRTFVEVDEGDEDVVAVTATIATEAGNERTTPQVAAESATPPIT